MLVLMTAPMPMTSQQQAWGKARWCCCETEQSCSWPHIECNIRPVVPVL